MTITFVGFAVQDHHITNSTDGRRPSLFLYIYLKTVVAVVGVGMLRSERLSHETAAYSERLVVDSTTDGLDNLAGFQHGITLHTMSTHDIPNCGLRNYGHFF